MQLIQLILSGLQVVLIFQRFVLIVKSAIFNMQKKEKGNPLETLGTLFTFLWDLLIMGSRCVIVYYAIMMKIWSVDPDMYFSFNEFCT